MYLFTNTASQDTREVRHITVPPSRAAARAA